MEDEELVAALLETAPYLPNGELLDQAHSEHGRELLQRAMPGLKERAKTLVELADGAAFLFANRPLDLDDKATMLLGDDGREALAGVADALRGQEHWSAASAEAAVRQAASLMGVKLGAVAQPLRAALTGRSTSPGVFDVLALLGREESLARIDDQLP